jgi:hypothetical protein
MSKSAVKIAKEISEKVLKKNKDELKMGLMKPIHEDFLFSQNGLTTIIGRVGSGKSYTYLNMLLIQERLFEKPVFEHAVICSTSEGFDKTVKAFKPEIKRTILEHVHDDNLMNWLNEYLEKFLLYNTLNAFINKGLKKPDDAMLEIINKYGLTTKAKTVEFIAKKLIEIGWNSYPHRLLLILDDFGAHPLLKKRGDPLSRMLLKLRHYNINVIVCVQSIRLITRELKRGIDDCIIFQGISRKDFEALMDESTLSGFDTDEAWNIYRTLKDREKMGLHTVAGKITVYE